MGPSRSADCPLRDETARQPYGEMCRAAEPVGIRGGLFRPEAPPSL